MFVVGKRVFEADIEFNVPSVNGSEAVSFGVKYEVVSAEKWNEAADKGDAQAAKLAVKKLYGIFDGDRKDISDQDGIIDEVLRDPFAVRALVERYIAVVYGGEVGSVREEKEKN